MITAPLRPLVAGERVTFSSQSPLGFASHAHLVWSPTHLVLIKTSPRVPSERAMDLPLAAAGWIADTIYRFLCPPGDGGLPGDVFAVNWEREDVPLRMRRAAQVEAPGEPGFSVIYRGRRTFRGGGFDEITWSDRMLFDAGLYRALVGIAVDWARATGHEPPLDPQARIRPHWMGARVGDTPPPAPE